MIPNLYLSIYLVLVDDRQTVDKLYKVFQDNNSIQRKTKQMDIANNNNNQPPQERISDRLRRIEEENLKLREERLQLDRILKQTEQLAVEEKMKQLELQSQQQQHQVNIESAAASNNNNNSGRTISPLSSSSSSIPPLDLFSLQSNTTATPSDEMKRALLREQITILALENEKLKQYHNQNDNHNDQHNSVDHNHINSNNSNTNLSPAQKHLLWYSKQVHQLTNHPEHDNISPTTNHHHYHEHNESISPEKNKKMNKPTKNDIRVQQHFPERYALYIQRIDILKNERQKHADIFSKYTI